MPEDAQQDSKRMKQFMKDMNENKFYPDNTYEHKAMLIDPKKKDDPYSDIVDTQLLLTNTGSDVLLLLNQQEAFIYTHLKNMASREKDLEVPYKVLYNSWRNELQLSRTKDGKERDMQRDDGEYSPSEYRHGFGDELAQFNPATYDNEEKQNIIQKFLKRRKR